MNHLWQLVMVMAGTGLVSSLATSWANRRKTKADTAEQISSACERMLRHQQTMIDRMQERIDALEAEVSALRARLV